MPPFPAKLAVQQRVLPAYRLAFFDLLAQSCAGGLALFAGDALPAESIPPADPARFSASGYVQYTPARNQHLFHPRHPLYACRQPNILAWLQAENPAALIIEANPRYPSNRAAIRWMHARGRPVLGWGLGAPPLAGVTAPLRARARTRLLASLDGILAYSRRGAGEYRALGVLQPANIFAAPNAIAPAPPSPSPDSHSPIPDSPSILFVGRLQTRKRLDLLLRACAALPPEIQPALTIVGDGPARAEFEQLAAAHYPRARFTGALHGEALAAEFAAADLFVLPGTGGLAVQEAMSHALPVIVAQGDGTQDDLVRPGNGWQVPPDDLPALTAALQAALTHPARLREMGAESYRIVRDEINIGKMAAAFLQALDAIRNT
jgi:glycosyltransferase involved in cell wall biosynthesis